jgi:hypothetical protein
MGMMPVTHIPGWERYIFGLTIPSSLVCDDRECGREEVGGVEVPFRVDERREALRGVRSSQLAERPGSDEEDAVVVVVEKKDLVYGEVDGRSADRTSKSVNRLLDSYAIFVSNPWKSSILNVRLYASKVVTQIILPASLPLGLESRGIK